MRRLSGALFLALLTLLMAACSPSPETEAVPTLLSLPALEATDLSGRPLRVVATTSIIGDVVAQVGGDRIDLLTLMAPGQDPHSFEPAAGDLTAASEADVVFVNGWALEEGLLTSLESVAEQVPFVPVSAGIEPLAAEEEEQEEEEHDEEEHAHAEGAIDPHVWMDPNLVQIWTDNIAETLGNLDPAYADYYLANAGNYKDRLAQLSAEMEAALGDLPAERRVLVTNHDALAYLAERFDLTVLGTVIPGASTLAEPSASALAALAATMEDRNICTIFAETTAADTLARAVAAELQNCDTVQVISLYTGATGPAGSHADSYLGMMEANLELLLQGLE